jgi:hypothetical protein
VAGGENWVVAGEDQFEAGEEPGNLLRMVGLIAAKWLCLVLRQA